MLLFGWSIVSCFLCQGESNFHQSLYFFGDLYILFVSVRSFHLDLKSPDGFKEFLEKAPQAVPMSEIAGGDALALKGDKPDEATMLVCKQLGVSAEDVQKYGMKEE